MSKQTCRQNRGRARILRIGQKQHARFWLIALICLAAVLHPSLSITSAQRPKRSPAPPVKTKSPVIARSARDVALAEATDEVLKETSQIRELPILRSVPSSTQSRAEIERTIIKNLNEETTPAQMHATEVTLKRLGLTPPDFQYQAFMVRLLTEQVAGYYDPKTRQFYLADWIDVDGQRPIMAHELTHALQDQHFNLRRFDNWPKGDSDAELAAHALIEGDATLSMMLYVAASPMRAVAFLKSLTATGMATAELDKAPRALRDSLLFPYQEGTDWTRNVYKQGGWSQVSRAFTELPQSTEQVLHSEKYFAHEAPVKVVLPDLSILLNAGRSGTGVSPVNNHAQDAHATWKRIDSDVEGEWGMYLLLDQFLKLPADSRRAAAGWGGDRYAVYENDKGETLFVSLSVWDTERDAREFFDAYAKRTRLRYPDSVQIGAPDADEATRNSKLETQNPEVLTLRTSEGLVKIELRGARVTVIEGVPAGVDANLLLTKSRN